MGPRALVAAKVRFHDIPVKERERFVEVGDAVGVGQKSVGVVAVSVFDPRIDLGNPDLAGVLDSILVVVNEEPGVEVRLPLLDANVPQVEGAKAAGAGGRGAARGRSPRSPASRGRR